MMELLIEYGANVNAVNNHTNESALTEAIVKCVPRLLSKL